MTYVKGYGLLAGYCVLTQVGGMNYWEVAPASRAIWIAGALAMLVAAFWRRQKV